MFCCLVNEVLDLPFIGREFNLPQVFFKEFCFYYVMSIDRQVKKSIKQHTKGYWFLPFVNT